MALDRIFEILNFEGSVHESRIGCFFFTFGRAKKLYRGHGQTYASHSSVAEGLSMFN